MCFEFVDQRLLELQLKLNAGATILQRKELKEVVSVVEGSVKLGPGERHIDVLGSLGPVHNEDSGDGRVNWSVQRNPKLPVIDSDGERRPLGADSWIIVRVKQKSQMKRVHINHLTQESTNKEMVKV